MTPNKEVNCYKIQIKKEARRFFAFEPLSYLNDIAIGRPLFINL